MHLYVKVRRHAGRKKKKGDGQAFVSGKKEYEKGFSYDMVRKIQKCLQDSHEKDAYFRKPNTEQPNTMNIINI